MPQPARRLGALAPAVPGRLVAVLLLLGSLLMTVSVPIDPPPTGEEPRGTIEAYAAEPERMDIAATLLHNGFLLFGLGLLLLGLIAPRGRGRTLALVGGIAACIGFADLSGTVLVDWMDSAAARITSVETAVQISEAAPLPWLLAGWLVPQTVASFLGPLLLLAGLARAGVTSWWLLAVPVVGTGVLLLVPGPLGVGLGFGANVVLAGLLARPLWAARTTSSERVTEPSRV